MRLRKWTEVTSLERAQLAVMGLLAVAHAIRDLGFAEELPALVNLVNSLLIGSIFLVQFGVLALAKRLAKKFGAEPWRIVKPPGFGMRSIARFLFSPKTYDHVFAPLIADYSHEWTDACSKNELAKAKWICIRYTTYFVMHIVLQGPLELYKLISAIRKMS